MRPAQYASSSASSPSTPAHRTATSSPLSRAAILLVQSFPSAAEGLGASRSAANLRRHGMEADVDVCARESVLDVVPRYVRRVGLAAEVTL